MRDLTIVISHGENLSFLSHCVEIIKEVPVLKDVNLRTDGFNSLANIEGIQSTTHSDRHGLRVYDLLNEIKSSRVFVVDSDFFCLDNLFWKNSLDGLDDKLMVTISKPWHLGIDPFPSTPFLGFDRKVVLDRVPERKAWDNFGCVFPHVKTPLFDNIKYVMLILKINSSVCYIDSWYPLNKRKYSFFHFWKSVKTLKYKMRVFHDMSLSEHTRYQHLCGALCQKVFEYVIGKGSFQEIKKDRFYFEDVKQKSLKGLIGPYLQIQDLTTNLGGQLIKEEHKLRFRKIKEFLNRFLVPNDIGIKL